ncbi:MAG: hypothetical protein Q9M48_14125 [Rhodobacterales bacterium]|nr:hypothetical protein [Rhodobacterales bacterium]
MCRFLPFLPLALLIGCTQFPALDNLVDPALESAAYPVLVPLEPLLRDSQNTEITPTTQAELAARVARLKARAARLRATVNPANS